MYSCLPNPWYLWDWYLSLNFFVYYTTLNRCSIMTASSLFLNENKFCWVTIPMSVVKYGQVHEIDFGTYHIDEQGGLRQVCTLVHPHAQIQKVLSEGIQLWQRCFLSQGERGSKYHYKWAIIGPLATHHLNGVLLACRWKE